MLSCTCMQTTLNILETEISKSIFELYGLSGIVFKIEHPANESFGDYACNAALILSKQLKQSPVNIANELCYKLTASDLVKGEDPTVKSISVAMPGFINFQIHDKWLNKLLTDILTLSDSYGSSLIGEGLRVALEHSNVNPNKAAHVGHLRNACIGQFLEKIYEFLGYQVEVQYYANNVGVQVATSNMGLTLINDISPTSYKKFDHYAWDVYAAMESRISQSDELKATRFELLKKLEDPQSIEFQNQKKLADKILLEQLKTFSQLDIDYDVVIYESDILNLKMWEKAFDYLKANPNVYKADQGPSKDCWLVKMGDEALTDDTLPSEEAEDTVEKDKIIVRSNGIPTYTGKDIAYHMWKFGLLDLDFNYEKWDSGTQKKPLWMTSTDSSLKSDVSFSKVDFVFDVIGTEQTYAMEAVKRSLKFLGYEKQATQMKHINYGFVYISRATAEKLGMDTTDGKKFYEMSGRKGWGVKIDDFIEIVDTQLKEKYGDFEYSRDVRNGAIKVQMLKTNTFQDLVFDLDEALDTKGYSGPYMQYAYVRTRSVGAKAGETTLTERAFTHTSYTPISEEYALAKWLCRFPEVISKAALEFAPNLLSDYLFELAKRYNTFYNNINILKTVDSDAKQYRLNLNESVGIVLKNGLKLMGITAPERM
jgi:arginyl-tRNA synthetase